MSMLSLATEKVFGKIQVLKYLPSADGMVGFKKYMSYIRQIICFAHERAQVLISKEIWRVVSGSEQGKVTIIGH